MINFFKHNSFFLSKNFQALTFSNSIFLYSAHLRVLLFSWLAYEITQKDIWVGIVLGVGGSQIFISSYLGSYLSEKYNINKILFYSYLSFLIILVLFIFINYEDIYVLLFFSILFGAIPGLLQPAFQTLLINTNDKSNFSKINSYRYLIIFFGEMVNPIIFAFLISRFDIDYVIFFAALLLFFSLILLLFHPADSQVKRKKEDNKFVSYSFILKNKPVIFWGVIIAAGQNIFGVTFFVLLPNFADQLGLGASGFGIMNAALGAGMFFGSLLSMFTGIYKSKLLIWILCTIVWDIGQVSVIFSENYTVSLFFLFFMGFSGAYWMVTSTLIFQDQTEKNDRNKIMGLYSLVISLFFIGWLIGGIISDITNPRIAITISALSSYPIFISGVLFSKKLRQV
ncbi:MAG: MFS transporter [Dehalococcoidales bacterium]|nr:MFS transporter [Dehalococcoidales bacterium]